MLSQKVQELELENKRLVMLIKDITKSEAPRPKDCETCKHYYQYYCRDKYGTYYKMYTGHCTCGVPAKKRKGRTSPSPEDTCLCYEERTI